MPRNGSGVFSPSENFATEAASPPIEISTLDDAFADVGDEITNSVAADGQTPMTGDLNMNSNKVINVEDATSSQDAVNLRTGDARYGRANNGAIKTSNYTAVAGDNLYIDKSSGSVTITLPASPAITDVPISITHVAGESNTLTVARNGKVIMGEAEDMVIDADYASIQLAFVNDTVGWRLRVIG